MVEEIPGEKNDRHRLDKNRKEGYPKERDQHVQRKACANNVQRQA